MHILLTGGGTAGHVVPNLALVSAMRGATKASKARGKKSKTAVRFTYMGSHHGIEKKLVKKAKIPFHAISTGKLRRYFSLQNVVDLFRIPLGVIQAYIKLGQLKPDLIFSKGGFVGFPVVLAGWLRRIPTVAHESDAIPGLATKLSAPFATKILLAYEKAADHMPRHIHKMKVVGTPVRAEIFKGKKTAARKLCHFVSSASDNTKSRRPRRTLLVMGGSSGAQQLNTLITEQKDQLTKHFNIIHITGEGKGKRQKEKHYFSLPYAHETLKDFYALADVCLSRAGANSLAELEALQIPSLLFPLGMHASRGDQLANAESLISRDKIFKLGDPSKSLTSQLKKLPARPSKTQKSKATQLIKSELASLE